MCVIPGLQIHVKTTMVDLHGKETDSDDELTTIEEDTLLVEPEDSDDELDYLRPHEMEYDPGLIHYVGDVIPVDEEVRRLPFAGPYDLDGGNPSIEITSSHEDIYVVTNSFIGKEMTVRVDIQEVTRILFVCLNHASYTVTVWAIDARFYAKRVSLHLSMDETSYEPMNRSFWGEIPESLAQVRATFMNEPQLKASDVEEVLRQHVSTPA